MSTTTSPSPTAAAEDPDRTSTPSPNPLRRGLSGLRRLGPPSPAEALRLSPRNYFFRATSNPSAPSPRTPHSHAASDSTRLNESQPLPPTQLEIPVVASTEDLEVPTRRAVVSSAPSPSPAPGSSLIMARHRPSGAQRASGSEALASSDAQRPTRGHENTSNESANTGSAQANGEAQETGEERARPPTICFFPHQDVRQARPSLTFAPIIRTLPSESSIIRVGRYSEREGIPVSNPSGPSDAPVGFKSKVVSRKHCEFSFVNGSWQIKDVSSSSGTFLNHIRLSQPNTESRLYPVKDGDLVQLGIDFRGGEEMIFRCVKIRIECNRSWQKRPNHFNINRHAQLRKLGEAGTKVDDNKGECSICLGDVAPCQSLFIAACAHVWHYKCIRRMLMGGNYPQFTCPNCRAITDLEAELDADNGDGWQSPVVEVGQSRGTAGAVATGIIEQPRPEEETVHAGGAVAAFVDTGDIDLTNIQFEDHLGQSNTDSVSVDQSLSSQRRLSDAADPSPNTAAVGMEIPRSSDAPSLPPAGTDGTAAGTLRATSPTSIDMIAGEGPLTPRNNAGPFVFDGSAGRGGDRLNAVANDGPVR